MRRLTLYIVLSLMIAAAATWIINLPGTITIKVAGYHLQPSLGASIAFLILLIAMAIAVWAIVRRLLEAPQKLAKRAQQRRRDLGVEALSGGFIALQAGDAQKARSFARDAQNKLPNNTAAQLLEARAELAMGDMVAAREHYRALISNPKTSLAALSGLYEQAQLQGRGNAALTFARKAASLDPKLTWANEAVFNDLAQTRAWEEALGMIASQPAPNRAEKGKQKHKRAVLNTAIAVDLEQTKPDEALAAATAALKLEPNFVPAALILARIFINRTEKRKAASVLRRVWRASRHPDVALLFANMQPGDSALGRLKSLQQIIDIPPADVQAARVLARVAIDAYEWDIARTALAPFTTSEPSQQLCTLMAEIEEGETGDQGKTREWLNRAVRAPLDETWVADGFVSSEWAPLSPVTNEFDAFEWRVPTTQVVPLQVDTGKQEEPKTEALALSADTKQAVILAPTSPSTAT